MLINRSQIYCSNFSKTTHNLPFIVLKFFQIQLPFQILLPSPIQIQPLSHFSPMITLRTFSNVSVTCSDVKLFWQSFMLSQLYKRTKCFNQFANNWKNLIFWQLWQYQITPWMNKRVLCFLRSIQTARTVRLSLDPNFSFPLECYESLNPTSSLLCIRENNFTHKMSHSQQTDIHNKYHHPSNSKYQSGYCTMTSLSFWWTERL